MAALGRSRSTAGIEIEIAGADALEVLAKRLKQAGRGELRKELMRELRAQGKPAIEDVRKRALATLPRSGGLAARVAGSRYSVRTRASGKSAGVRIEATGRTVKALKPMNEGNLRHPVYPKPDIPRREWTWVSQRVEPGFFSDPIEARAPEIRRGMLRVMNDIANKIERAG